MKIFLCVLLLSCSLYLTPALSQYQDWQSANVCQILIDATARYQQSALFKMQSKMKKDTSISQKLNFYIALDYLIMERYATYKNDYLDLAINYLKQSHIQNNPSILKSLTLVHSNDIQKCLSVFENPIFTGNKIIHIYLKYLKTRDISYLDTDTLNKLIIDDHDSIETPFWNDTIRLYNPFTWICLCELYFEKSRQFYEKTDLTQGNNLYFLLDALNALKKFEQTLEQVNTPGLKTVFKHNHFLILKAAEAYYKLNQKEQADALIQKLVSGKCSDYVHFEIAHYHSKILNDPISAKQYLFKHVPQKISPQLQDYHHLSDSTSHDEISGFYYRTLAKIYKNSGNLSAAFRCFYYVYRHSSGLDMEQYDPKYIANVISTALNQNVRPLLEEYLLRPPGRFGPKCYVEMYPACYAIMYYYGCLNKLEL